MANANFTLQSTKKTRAGATACLNTLCAIDRLSKRRPRSDGDDGHVLWGNELWKIKDEAIEAMFIVTGKQNAFMTGFFATIAEYVILLQEEGGLSLDDWKPEAIMTEVEKAASRAQFVEDVTTPK